MKKVWAAAAACTAFCAGVLMFCVFASRGVVPRGLFVLQSGEGGLSITPGQILHTESIYSDMAFDTSNLEDGLLLITAEPYQPVNSYRRAEEAASLLNAGGHRLHEAGLAAGSIAEKLRVLLWGMYLCGLIIGGMALYGYARKKLNRARALLERLYIRELLTQKRKRLLAAAAPVLPGAAAAAGLWVLLSFIPLMPASIEGLPAKLWGGLAGYALLPAAGLWQNAGLERLSVLNHTANLALLAGLVLLAAMTVMFAGFGKYRKRP